MKALRNFQSARGGETTGMNEADNRHEPDDCVCTSGFEAKSRKPLTDQQIYLITRIWQRNEGGLNTVHLIQKLKEKYDIDYADIIIDNDDGIHFSNDEYHAWGNQTMMEDPNR